MISRKVNARENYYALISAVELYFSGIAGLLKQCLATSLCC